MRTRLLPTLATAVLIPAAIGAALSSTSTITSISTTTEPCALVSAALHTADGPNVPATLAYECLLSVPVDVQNGIKLIEELKLYMQWQSDTTYLKKPPKTSRQEPFDVYDELNNISQKLKTGTYKSEYVLQQDIYDTFTFVRDGHTSYGADILGVFTFSRGEDLTLVSVSSDGHSLPKLFTLGKFTY